MTKKIKMENNKNKNKYIDIRSSNNPRLSININFGKINVFNIEKESFKQIKEVCDYYQKTRASEWAVYCGISFFKKQ